MATIDAIFQNLKSNANYASLSDDLLYDIASSLYKQSSYKSLELYFQGQMDPYAFSVFAGENLIWAQFTYTELIQMEEAGVLIPEEVLAWAHSMQDADSTNYEAAETFASDDAAQIEQELNNTEESQLVNLRKVAKSLIAECTNNETSITQKLEQLDVVKKLSENTQSTAEDVQKTALQKMQQLVDEWKALEGKLKRGEALSDGEQKRFDELAGLLNAENKQYQKDMNGINIDFEEIAASLNEIDIMSQDTTSLSMETEAVGTELAETEKKHHFVSTSTNSLGNNNFIMSSSISKNLAQTAIETGNTTFTFAQDVQVTVNEVASIMNLTEEVTEKANKKPQTEITDDQTDSVENLAKEGAENEIENAQSTSKTATTQTSKTSAPTQTVAQTQTNATATGTPSIEGTASPEAPQETSTGAETETLVTDNTEEAGNDLRTQTQDQIDTCNTRSSEITNAVNEIDPLKKAVEDIKKESKFESRITEAKVAKQLKDYEQLCDKMKNGEMLSNDEQNRFNKLNEELDAENGKYVKGLDEKINTLQGFTRSLNYALDVVNQTFDLANATVEMGKQLAIQELGDRSYLMENFYFMLLDDERQKDLLYGKAGESLGRDAIDRGEILNKEATDANTSLTKQIPLSNFAQDQAGKVGEQKNAYVEKVTAITKDVPGVDANAENQKTQDTQGSENAEGKENSELTDASVEEMTSQAGELTSETNDISETAEKSDEQAQKDAKYAAETAKKAQKTSAQYKAQQAATNIKIQALNSDTEAQTQKVEEAYANTDETATVDEAGQEPQEAVEAKNVITLNNTEVVTLIGDSIKATQNLTNDATKETAKIEKAEKSNEAANEECSKFEEIVSKTDKVMSWVTTGGVALGLTGIGMQLLGKAMLSNPFTAAAGAALITAGTISFNIGVAAEQAGILGGTACKLAKTGIAIADGDILGALKNLAIAGAVVGGAVVGGTVGRAMVIAGEVAGVATGMIDENSRSDGEKEEEQQQGRITSQFGHTKVIGNENIVDEDGTTEAQRKAAATQANETQTETTEETEETENSEETKNTNGTETTEGEEEEKEEELTDASVKEMTTKAGQLTSETNAMGATAEKSRAQAQKDTKYAEVTAKKFKELNEKDKVQQEETAAKVEIVNNKIAEEEQKIEQAYANAKANASINEEENEPQEATEAKNVIKIYNTEVVTLIGNSERATQKLRRYRLTEAAKIQQATNSNNQANEECSKFEEIVSKTDKVMSWVTVSGIGLELTGIGMQALGKLMLSNPWTAAAGAALITAGTVSFNIGVAAETAGVIGSTACKVVKAGIAIAEGDIWGALKNLAIAGAVVGGAMLGGAAGLAVGAAGEVAGIATGMIDENSRPDGEKEETEEKEEKKSTSQFGHTKVIGNENIVDEDGTTEAQRKAAAANNAQTAQNTTVNANGANTTSNNEASTEKSAVVAPTSAQAAPKVEGQSTDTTKAIENDEKDGEGEEVNAKNGKQAAKDSAKDTAETKSGTRNTEEDGKEAEKVDKQAQKTDKEMQKDSKALQKSIKKDEQTLAATEAKVQETVNKIEEEGLAIETAQTEVEGLISLEEQNAMNADTPTEEGQETTGAGFSIMNNATIPTTTSSSSNVSSGTSDNQVKMGELNTQIMQRSNKMGLYSGQLAKYQTNSDKLIRRMKINNVKFNKAVKKEEKEKKEHVSTSEQILKKAEKFEKVSQTVATVGMVVGYTGDLLMKVVLPPWIPVVGAVMSPIGHAAEAAGNYGVLAANVTKTAVYAAQGNLTGALMSIGVAAMSYVSANGAAKQATKGFQQMGKNIAVAQGRAATYKAAQEGAKAAVKGTGDAAMKQLVEKTKNEMLVQGIKNQSKAGMKAVLKQAGKAALMNANNIVSTAQSAFSSSDDKKQEKKEYQLSARFREIQRKNATRRRKIAQAYGMSNTGSGTQKNK